MKDIIGSESYYHDLCIFMKLGLELQEFLLITMYVRMRSGGTAPLFHQFCLEFVEIASSAKY